MYRDVPYGCEIRDFVVFVNQFPVTVWHFAFGVHSFESLTLTCPQHTEEVLPWNGEAGPFVRLGFVAWPGRFIRAKYRLSFLLSP